MSSSSLSDVRIGQSLIRHAKNVIEADFVLGPAVGSRARHYGTGPRTKKQCWYCGKKEVYQKDYCRDCWENVVTAKGGVHG